MNGKIRALLALCCAFGALASATAAYAGELHTVYERNVGGFVNPESVGCDVPGKMLYVGNFGSPKLDPGLKDGMGYISKVALSGRILDKHFLPGPGGEKLNKPKGIWIHGNRLWVADIDSVWVFDLKTRKGRKLPLPSVVFANDVAVMDNMLYVSDNRSDQLVKIEPADFLHAKHEPKITQVFKGAGVYPNGLYPMSDGMLLMVGFEAPKKPHAIYALGVSGQIKQLSEPIGRLDGAYDLGDGSVLATDWDAGSLFRWTEDGKIHKLAGGFKGPADFCVLPHGKGMMTVVLPDLVTSRVRFIDIKH